MKALPTHTSLNSFIIQPESYGATVDEGFIVGGPVGDFELLLCHGMVCVVGRMRDLILQLSKSSIYSTKPIRSAFAKKRLVFSGFTQTKGTGIHYKRGLSDRRIDIKYGVFSTPSFKVLISLRFIFKSATCPCNPLLNKHLFMLSLFG